MGEEDLVGCQIQKPQLFRLPSLLILTDGGFPPSLLQEGGKARDPPVRLRRLRQDLLQPPVPEREGWGQLLRLNPPLVPREVQPSWVRASLPLPVSSGATRTFGDPLDRSGFACPSSIWGILAVVLELELGDLNCPRLSEAG